MKTPMNIKVCWWDNSGTQYLGRMILIEGTTATIITNENKFIQLPLYMLEVFDEDICL